MRGSPGAVTLWWWGGGGSEGSEAAGTEGHHGHSYDSTHRLSPASHLTPPKSPRKAAGGRALPGELLSAVRVPAGGSQGWLRCTHRAVPSPIQHCSSPAAHGVETSAREKAAPGPGSFAGLCPFPAPPSIGPRERPSPGITSLQSPGKLGRSGKSRNVRSRVFQLREAVFSLRQSRDKASSLHVRAELAAAWYLQGHRAEAGGSSCSRQTAAAERPGLLKSALVQERSCPPSCTGEAFYEQGQSRAGTGGLQTGLWASVRGGSTQICLVCSSCLLLSRPPGFLQPFLVLPCPSLSFPVSPVLFHSSTSPRATTNRVLGTVLAACTTTCSLLGNPENSVMRLWGQQGVWLVLLCFPLKLFILQCRKCLFWLHQNFIQTFTCLPSPCDKCGCLPASTMWLWSHKS